MEDERMRTLLLLLLTCVWTPAQSADSEVLCDHPEDCLLPCGFDPGPAPIINWIKKPLSLTVFSINDSRLQNVDEEYRGRASLSEEELRRGNASLLLRQVKVQDEGEYECVTSTTGSDPMESTLRLRVRAPVRQVFVRQQGQQLECSSGRIYPEPGVVWSISTGANTRVTPSEQGLFSVISSVSVSDSVNQYICNISTAYDWRSATYRNNSQMSFSDAPVTVPCSESSAPVKTLIWSFNHSETILTRTGSELVYFTSWRQFVDGLTESNSLVLKDLTQDQQGLFTCELSTESEQFIINTEVIKAQAPVAPVPSTWKPTYPVMAAIGNRGTVTEASGFNAEQDAQKLREAMKGAGTDEAAIIEVLTHRTIAQRQLIMEAYKQAVGKEMADDLSSELSGHFERVVLGLLMLAPEYDASELRYAMKGAGAEEDCLVDILASRSNEEIRAITAFYKKEFGKPLEDDVNEDTFGMFQRVLVTLLEAGRDESDTVDEAQAVLDAKEIFEAGEAQWGTDEVKFLSVLCARNRNHLLRVFDEYLKLSGREIETSIEREMSGSLAEVFLAIVKCMRSKPAFFAERLYRKGRGTTDTALIRTMVSRAEIDMLDIKAEFQKMYEKTLCSFIEGNTSGNYRKILLELCGGE